ncbi:MAG: hypothetical protein ACI977_000634 [Candidatus Nanohaloarchaea archaeon]|jgi:hypothetical protein
MGSWGEAVNRFLNGDKIETPDDFAALAGSNIPDWHPSQAAQVSGEESTSREHINRDEVSKIGNIFERYAAQDYGAQLEDKGEVDIRIGFSDRAEGWPVQVKSAALYRKAGEDSNGNPAFRRGAFKIRHHNYKDLPDRSLIDFNIYNPAHQRQENGFDTLHLEEDADEGVKEMYLELHGKMLVPKQVLEESIEADLTKPPEDEDSAWYRSREYELNWDEVFGVNPWESPVYQEVRSRSMEDQGIDPSHDITQY